jgi:hypothetical protein
MSPKAHMPGPPITPCVVEPRSVVLAVSPPRPGVEAMALPKELAEAGLGYPYPTEGGIVRGLAAGTAETPPPQFIGR